ncbi:MAG: hypothetical protein OXC29_19080 [Rhodococcus sp.]|nr:hypothetical protein [Rhodococcus sp. (in: high G+C Gram-positive bacteria)]
MATSSGISSDKMYVTLMPISAGTATIRVTAADTASGGATATVSFDATVMAQAAIVGRSQAEVDKVFIGRRRLGRVASDGRHEHSCSQWPPA